MLTEKNFAQNIFTRDSKQTKEALQCCNAYCVKTNKADLHAKLHEFLSMRCNGGVKMRIFSSCSVRLQRPDTTFLAKTKAFSKCFWEKFSKKLHKIHMFWLLFF